MSGERVKGTCKWFNAKKGFGFLAPETGGEDIFVHHSSLKCEGTYRSIKDNAEVEFEIITDEKGKPKAANVTGPDGAFLEPAAPTGGDFGGRPPRRDFGGDRPRRDFGDRPRRDFGDRPPRDFGDRPRRDFGDRPRRDFGGERQDRSERYD